LSQRQSASLRDSRSLTCDPPLESLDVGVRGAREPGAPSPNMTMTDTCQRFATGAKVCFRGALLNVRSIIILSLEFLHEAVVLFVRLSKATFVGQMRGRAEIHPIGHA